MPTDPSKPPKPGWQQQPGASHCTALHRVALHGMAWHMQEQPAYVHWHFRPTRLGFSWSFEGRVMARSQL
jgi:hypothetical protein